MYTTQHTLSRDYKQLFHSLVSPSARSFRNICRRLGLISAHKLINYHINRLAALLLAGCAVPSSVCLPPYIDDVYLPYMIIYIRICRQIYAITRRTKWIVSMNDSRHIGRSLNNLLADCKHIDTSKKKRRPPPPAPPLACQSK